MCAIFIFNCIALCVGGFGVCAIFILTASLSVWGALVCVCNIHFNCIALCVGALVSAGEGEGGEDAEDAAKTAAAPSNGHEQDSNAEVCVR